MKKRIISFMLSLFMVLTLLAPAVNAEAATTTGEYDKVGVVNPVANTWNTGTAYPTDGGPAYAFNGDTSNWWHTNYGGAEDGNKNVGSFTNAQVSQIPAFSEISGSRVWIGGEFECAVNLGKFTYRARTNNQTANWIEQWALYTANVTTGEPTDADFVLAANGTFGQECSGTNAVDIEVELTAPVKATHFRLVAFTFNGGQATASNIEMYSVSQINLTLRSGESVTYTFDGSLKIDNPTLSGLDSNIVSGEVIEGRKRYPYSMAKLATTTANFNGEEKELKECLFTFASVEGYDNTYVISNTEGNSTIYFASGMSSSAQKPCVSSGNDLQVAVGFDNGKFTFNNQYSNPLKNGYLYFWKNNNAKLHFDRTDTLETSNYNTHFDLFVPSEDAPADSEIKGYKKLTGLEQIEGGKSYLIAAKANDGNYYILNPVVSGDAHNYVAQIVTYETQVQLASAAGNFNDAAGVKKASDCLFTFTYIGEADGGKNYRISGQTENGTTVYLNHRKDAGIATTTNAEAVTTLKEKSASEKSSFSLCDVSTNSTASGYLYFHRSSGYHYNRNSSPDGNCYFKLYEPSSNATSGSPIEGYVEVTSLDSIKDGGKYLIVNTDTNETPNYYFMYPFNGGSNYQYVAKMKNYEAGTDTTITFTGENEGETSVIINGITYHITVQNENREVIIRDDETIYIPGTSLQGEVDPNNVINVVDQTGAPYTRAENIEDGYYLLGSTSHLVINSASGSTGLVMQAADYTQGDYSAYIWKVKAEGDGYTLQDINGKYINFSGSSVVLSDTPQVLNIMKRSAGGFALSDGKYYLNNYSGGNHTAAGWSGNDNAWYFYRVGIEITSAALGNATIMLDGINYQIESLPMSKAELQADITNAESMYSEEDYLVRGWRGYVAALAEAKEWAEKATRQTEVNAARKKLAAAIAELVSKPVYVEPTATELAAGAPTGMTEGQPFARGTGGSNNFRIPAMITLSDGTIIAAADARWNHAGDACSIDIMVSKSTDNGATWNYSIPAFFNDSTNAKHLYGACFIDPVLARDKNDKIYMMVDLYPAGIAINTAPAQPHTASGFVEIEGKKRLVLYLSSSPEVQTDTNYAYYVGDYVGEGKEKFAPVYEVYAENEYSDTASYYIDPYFNLYTADKEPMYCLQLADESKRVQQNVFFLNSQLHVRCATYLYLITSEDKGETWSEPMLLNAQIRKDENLDKFYGVGPGAGLWFDDGTEQGTIMLPAYTHSNERSSFIYSTDGGTTWKRSQEATTTQSSESCLVQLDDKTVRHFYRSNEVHKIQYTDHTLVEGEWIAGEKITLDVARNAGNQVSAIRYSKTIDGKPVIIFSTAADNRRINGKLYIFTVDMNETGMPMTLVASYDNDPTTATDKYAYSSIAELKDGSIGLLYESNDAEITYKVIPMSEFEPDVTFDIPASEDGVASQVAGYTLSLDGNIGVNFHMLLGEEVIADAVNGAYMKFTVNGNVTEIPVAGIEPDENGYYIFTCSVPVKDMDTEIKAQIILSNNREGSVHSYTVNDYVYYIANGNGNYSQEEKDIVEAMSNFGAYTSAYFAEKMTGEMPELQELSENDMEDLKAQVGEVEQGNKDIYAGSSLLLKSDTIVRHYFKEKVTEDAIAKDGLYYIQSEGIPAHLLGETLTMEVEGISITYNPLSYAYRVLSSDNEEYAQLKDVMHAMYLYYKQACEYKAAKSN